MANHSSRAVIDTYTVVAIAAIAISLNVAFHEGIHALTALSLGGTVTEYSAHHVASEGLSESHQKVVAGSASIANLILGTLLWVILRKTRTTSESLRFFLWLFMLMNWLYGAGYWAFSGVANVGDWAKVISGWEPHWLWRIIMTLIGFLSFMFFVYLALCELGRMIGGSDPEQIRRAVKLGFLSYAAALCVSLLAALFSPYGLLGLPALAGMAAPLGALSPLLWMMQWFRAKRFAKPGGPPLEIPRNRGIIGVAIIVVFLYAYVLGSTLYF